MIKKQLLAGCLTAALFLGTYRGYLALFEKGAEDPIQIYPCKADTLPQSVQDQLTQRIRVRDQEELERLLENYCS